MTDPAPDDLRPGKPPDWYEQNPHARFSFSRLATYRRCPGWFRHQYLDWHRTWSTPILQAGHAVQEVLERVFDSAPADDVTLETLEERAFARMGTLFGSVWDRTRREHEEDPNGYGPWDLPRTRYEGYLKKGLRWHMMEVEARLAGKHPRTGDDLALDPVAGVAEAWAAVRPRHAAQGAELSETMETVPAGFFQGQYDLVYDWTGGRRIVDLKASSGASAFSTEIEVQLLSYAFLERENGRGRPEGIEAWFLGADTPTVFPVPEDAELDGFAREVVRLIALAGSEGGFDAWDPADFPIEPSPLDGFRTAEGDASPWCAYCPAALTCAKARKEAPPAGDGLDFRNPPESGSVHVEGIVLGVAEPRERPDGRVKVRFTLANETGTCSFTWAEGAVRHLLGRGLRAGRTVRITGVRPWTHPGSGKVMFFDSQTTDLQVLAEAP